jgi:hypothetical protein
MEKSRGGLMNRRTLKLDLILLFIGLLAHSFRVSATTAQSNHERRLLGPRRQQHTDTAGDDPVATG